MDKNNKIVDDLFESFVYDEDFEGKRFDRYVKRTKNFIFEVLNEVYPIVFDKNNGLGFVACDFEDFIISVFNSFYFSEESTEKGLIFDCMHEYFIPDFDADVNNKEFKKNLIQMPKLNDGVEWSFYNMIVAETKNACKEFIREKCALKGYDKSNYFLSLPETTFEAFYILKNILNWLYIDIERLTNSHSDGAFKDLMQEKVYTEMKEDIESMDILLKEKDETISSKDKEIEKLKTQLEKSNKKEEEIIEHFAEVKETNNTLVRQNNKLMEKYNELLSKYNSLKVEIPIQVEDMAEEKSDLKELDVLGNYIFVVYDDASFAYKLKDVFKNSLFINANKTINKEATDLVIALTSHIDHTTYNAIKNQCKSKGIPFIHCDYCNLELIKQMMWNELNL